MDTNADSFQLVPQKDPVGEARGIAVASADNFQSRVLLIVSCYAPQRVTRSSEGVDVVTKTSDERRREFVIMVAAAVGDFDADVLQASGLMIPDIAHAALEAHFKTVILLVESSAETETMASLLPGWRPLVEGERTEQIGTGKYLTTVERVNAMMTTADAPVVIVHAARGTTPLNFSRISLPKHLDSAAPSVIVVDIGDEADQAATPETVIRRTNYLSSGGIIADSRRPSVPAAAVPSKGGTKALFLVPETEDDADRTNVSILKTLIAGTARQLPSMPLASNPDNTVTCMGTKARQLPATEGSASLYVDPAETDLGQDWIMEQIQDLPESDRHNTPTRSRDERRDD